MATTPKQTLTLDGSGELTTVISDSFEGELLAILINKDGQTNNPTVVITENGTLGRTILTITQTASGDNVYHVRAPLVVAAGTAITNSYDRYCIESSLTATIASGDAGGTVTIAFQYKENSQ